MCLKKPRTKGKRNLYTVEVLSCNSPQEVITLHKRVIQYSDISYPKAMSQQLALFFHSEFQVWSKAE